MTKISEPHVMTYHSPKPEDWGVSGFVIIAESHISVHTFPARQFVNIDIFSCREFDPQRALEQASAFFSLVSVHTWVLERGLEHYSPEEARQALAAERAGLAGAP
jgi:S-adenosylmethionine decarboxylase